jgi:pimeloyl-ACP methyl ester carboxylesterase
VAQTSTVPNNSGSAVSRVLVPLAALVLAVAACSSSAPARPAAPAAASSTSSTPAGAATRTGRLGDVVKVSPWDALPGVRTWLVLYRSSAVDGSGRVVSAVVGVPDRAAPAGGWPLLAWAHGTTGLADKCAPSQNSAETDVGLHTVMSQAPLRGYAVVATDYEGLGTPGPHPYVVNIAEAQNVLDSIRAAERLPGTGLSPATKTVVWGHSQGGGAAALTAELAPHYAPEVRLVGVAVGAPATELADLDVPLRTSPFFGYVLMVASGFRAAYPNLPFDQALTPRGVAELDLVQAECSSESVGRLRGAKASDYLARPVADVPALRAVLDDNSAGHRPTPVPMFVYQGGADEQIPVATSARMVQRMCAAGGYTVIRKVYPGVGHSQAAFVAAPDVLNYFADRLAGKPAPTQC